MRSASAMRRLAPPATGLIALLATALTLAGGGLTGPSRAAPIEQAHLRSSALRASSLAAADGDRARSGSAKADEPTESVAFGYQFLAATPMTWPNASSFSGPVNGTVDTDWPRHTMCGALLWSPWPSPWSRPACSCFDRGSAHISGKYAPICGRE